MAIRSRSRSPFRRVAQGVAAGIAGTALMTAWQTLSSKLQGSGGGGDEEPSDAQEAWEQAPAPAQVAATIGEATVGERPPADRIPQLTQAMHWGYGISWGAVYGAVRGSADGVGAARDGVLFGTGVWAASYAQLVPMGLYQPPWKCPPTQLALDLSYHLVYGLGVAGTHRVLDRL